MVKIITHVASVLSSLCLIGFAAKLEQSSSSLSLSLLSHTAVGYYEAVITTARGATNSSVNFTWTDNFTQFVRADEQSFPICMRLRVRPHQQPRPLSRLRFFFPFLHFPSASSSSLPLRARLSVWRCQLGISASITFREHTKNPSFVWFSHDKLATCHALRPPSSALSAASFGRVFTSFPKCNWNSEHEKKEWRKLSAAC